MTDTNFSGKGSKKRKILSSLSSIAESGDHRYTSSYTDTLYSLGISDSVGTGIIPSVPRDVKVRKFFAELKDLLLLSGVMKS